MRNNDLIATAVCAQYTPEQLPKLAAHYFRDRWGKKEPNDR